MKKICDVFPFLLLFVLATGSVGLSCALERRGDSAHGLPALSMNTGPDEDGRIHSPELFSRVERVYLFDRGDRKKKRLLEASEWSYDMATGELVLSPRITVSRQDIVRLEGRGMSPHRAILNGYDPASGDPLVMLDGREGLKEYDYRFDARERTLVFRSGLDFERLQYLVQYGTAGGAASFGNWQPGTNDAFSFIQARRQAEQLARFYASREMFWFFAGPTDGETPPGVVLRRPTESERSNMRTQPVLVCKYRFGCEDRAVADEVGYPVATPRRIPFDGGVFVGLGKIIEEQVGAGGIESTVSELYSIEGQEFTGRALELRQSTKDPSGPALPGSTIPAAMKTIDLGLPVERALEWALETKGGLDARPEVVRLVRYAWTIDRVRFSIAGTTAEENRMRDLARAVIAARK